MKKLQVSGCPLRVMLKDEKITSVELFAAGDRISHEGEKSQVPKYGHQATLPKSARTAVWLCLTSAYECRSVRRGCGTKAQKIKSRLSRRKTRSPQSLRTKGSIDIEPSAAGAARRQQKENFASVGPSAAGAARRRKNYKCRAVGCGWNGHGREKKTSPRLLSAAGSPTQKAKKKKSTQSTELQAH